MRLTSWHPIDFFFLTYLLILSLLLSPAWSVTPGKEISSPAFQAGQSSNSKCKLCLTKAADMYMQNQTGLDSRLSYGLNKTK